MKRISELVTLISLHKSLYYSGQAEIEDHEYDAFEEELRSLDPNNPVLTMVGSVPSGQNKVSHDTPMLSLNKTYVVDDLKDWIGDNEAVSMFKFDGVSCSLIYKKGTLILAKTRGNGKVGEDITHKVMWMKGVPHQLSQKIDVEIRGEMYCTETNFLRLSKEMERLGLDKPSSMRNIVAGLVGRKDHIVLNRHLNFMAFDLISDSVKIKSEYEKFQLLDKLSFNTPEVKLHKNHSDIELSLNEAQDFMNEGDYLIDGIVFSYNKLSLQEELGSTSHHPRYKMAFKFQGESKEATIKDITWQVSRNGILTPVAEINPVDFSGAKISRVTLHNYGVVDQFQLKGGDIIEVIRSGEVIPKFLRVKKSSQNAYTLPAVCPSCDHSVEIEDIRIVCRNNNCPAQVKETILNFIQKIGIDDLSSKRLEEMINAGLVSKISDLYTLKASDLLTLNKVKDKLANKLITSIKASKGVDLATFLGSLGIQGGGRSKCAKIVKAGFNEIEKIKSLSIDELITVESFAQKSSEEFLTSLARLIPMIEDMQKLGFTFTKNETIDSPFSGKSFCITGSLSRKRSDIEKEIKSLGGSVSSSVSKNTHFLLTNDQSPKSSKYKKALDLGTEVISEEEFYSRLRSS